MRYLLAGVIFALLVVIWAPQLSSGQESTTPEPHPHAVTLTACDTSTPITASVPHLQELLPNCNYRTWFTDNTHYQPNPHYFGAYKFLPWGADLYLGFGTARPAESNGSLLAQFQNHALSGVGVLDEQGFIDMTPDVALPIIHIPGADPTNPALPGGSPWDLGNTYVFTPTTGLLTEHRDLPNVIHTWGIESTSQGLYAAVSSHLGDYETWTGEVFRSTDAGQNWTSIADKNSGVGDYRTYDIAQFDGALFAVWNDEYGQGCGLTKSTDGGITWQRINAFSSYTTCRSRLFVYNNQLLVLGSARDGILALHTNGSVTPHLFSNFKAQDWIYNALAVDAQNRLYMLAEDGRIMRTTNLITWETMAAADRDFITLSYWPDQDKIVVADRGNVARVWLLDPSNTPIMPPAAPAASISISGSDVQLQWPAQSGLTYQIYRNTEDPSFTPPIQSRYASTSTGLWQDAGALAQEGKTYYEVRAINAAGEFSGVTQTLARFTFALTPSE